MATPPILDFERLLAPISDERPTGPFWREDSAARDAYLAVKTTVDESRRSEKDLDTAPSEEDASRDPKLPVAKIEPPRWNQVVSGAVDAISTKTKDLWLCAWLIEALARLPGREFAGIRDGFRLVRELGERYWGQLNPPPDEDDLAEGTLTTVAQLAGLNGVESDGTLVRAIRKIVISEEADGEQQLADVEECLAEFRKMTALLDEKCGRSPEGEQLAPPSTQLLTELEKRRDELRQKYGVAPAPGDEESGGAGSTTGPAKEGSGAMTRETAFKELLRIADFFQKTEPHSPVSYALRQVVTWGKMSLPDLLVDLLPQSDARVELFKRTGIPEPKEE